MDAWDPRVAPVGIFFRWIAWTDVPYSGYLTNQSLEVCSSKNFYENWLCATPSYICKYTRYPEQERLEELCKNFYIHFGSDVFKASSSYVAATEATSTVLTVPRFVSDIVVPEIARGYEAIYEKFLRGVLIYLPQEGSDLGKIEIPIAALANPLNGTFDLSRCGDIGEYLSIATGYRSEKKVENANKIEIWLAPRFLIDRELQETAKHFNDIMNSWKPSVAPIGFFFTSAQWDISWYFYLTNQSLESCSSRNMYANCNACKRHTPWHPQAGPYDDTKYLTRDRDRGSDKLRKISCLF